MAANNGFIKMMRMSADNCQTWDFLMLRPAALCLFTLMAHRARRQGGIDPRTGIDLEAGECLLGDYKTAGLTERQYRTAKNDIQKAGLATFRATNKGTVGKIINLLIYDLNISGCDEQNDTQATDETTGKRQATDDRETTNKEFKEQGKKVEEMLQQKYPQLTNEALNFILGEVERINPKNSVNYADSIAVGILENRGELTGRQKRKEGGKQDERSDRSNQRFDQSMFAAAADKVRSIAEGGEEDRVATARLVN